MLKVLIADDDDSLSFILKKALSKIQDIEVLATVENGAKAVHFFSENEVDVVFLDIDMPVLDGIEAAKLISDMSPKTFIVFVTAHNEYMSDAFELYAFDYIVKPFKLDRLSNTIDKIKLLRPEKDTIDELKKSTSQEILFKSKDSLIRLDLAEIIMVMRENRNTMIVTEHEKYPITKTISEIEELLPKPDFMRSHKSYIIRLDKISKISKYGRWTYIVHLKGIKEDALLTREKGVELEAHFNTKIITD